MSTVFDQMVRDWAHLSDLPAAADRLTAMFEGIAMTLRHPEYAMAIYQQVPPDIRAHLEEAADDVPLFWPVGGVVA